jgi:hypothetical protein
LTASGGEPKSKAILFRPYIVNNQIRQYILTRCEKIDIYAKDQCFNELNLLIEYLWVTYLT